MEIDQRSNRGPPGLALTTQELSLHFMRPASPDCGKLIGRGHVIHGGRSIGLFGLRPVKFEPGSAWLSMPSSPLIQAAVQFWTRG